MRMMPAFAKMSAVASSSVGGASASTTGASDAAGPARSAMTDWLTTAWSAGSALSRTISSPAVERSAGISIAASIEPSWSAASAAARSGTELTTTSIS
jgi:hypothetical protein